jgi:hypothetical protein
MKPELIGVISPTMNKKKVERRFIIKNSQYYTARIGDFFHLCGHVVINTQKAFGTATTKEFFSGPNPN